MNIYEEARVTEDEIALAFAGTNFGEADHRRLLVEAVLKAGAGFHNGSGMLRVLKDLRLVSRDEEVITRRGAAFAMFAVLGDDEEATPDFKAVAHPLKWLRDKNYSIRQIDIAPVASTVNVLRWEVTQRQDGGPDLVVGYGSTPEEAVRDAAYGPDDPRHSSRASQRPSQVLADFGLQSKLVDDGPSM